jgi:aminocarboxymuconate-semialdehyde decarboxylase
LTVIAGGDDPLPRPVEADRIDIHTHGFPESYLRGIAARYPGQVRLAPSGERLFAYWMGAPLPAWELSERLNEMARDGVTSEVLSAPPIYAWLDESTADFCRELNDFQASTAEALPGRFRSFLHIPVHEPGEAIRELARFQGHREVAGVVLASNMGGLYPGDAALLPIWEAIHDMDLAVFIHPLNPAACFGPAVPPVVLFPADTTLEAASIIYAGLFDRFPGLRIILSHYGGALPFLAARLDMAIDIPGFAPGHGQNLRLLPSRYVERFYFDTAQGFHRAAFECARSAVGLDHLLYGSDHFFVGSSWRARLNQFLHELDLAPGELAALLSGTARRTLRL